MGEITGEYLKIGKRSQVENTGLAFDNLLNWRVSIFYLSVWWRALCEAINRVYSRMVNNK